MILVSTKALQEGVDVPDCQWVVRYDGFFTTKVSEKGEPEFVLRIISRAAGAQGLWRHRSTISPTIQMKRCLKHVKTA